MHFFKQSLLLSVLMLISCSDGGKGDPYVNPLDKYEITAAPDKICTEPDSIITVFLTIKDTSGILINANYDITIRVLWWISCSQPGLSDWSTLKTFSGSTGPNGRDTIEVQFGTSSYAGANYKHFDFANVTTIDEL